MLGATCSATCHVGSRLGGTATARGSAAGFASLSVLRRQATTDLVFHQIDDAGPFVGTSRTLYNQTPSMDHGILSVAPVWHSSSVADAINEAAGEALLAAHESSLRAQADELCAEASSLLQAATNAQQAALEVALSENRALQEQLAAATADAVAVPAPQAAEADSAELERLREQLTSAHSFLRTAVLDKAFCDTPATELLALPANTLQGLGGKTVVALESAGISTVGDLAAWQFLAQARTLAATEPATPAVGLASVCAVQKKTLGALRIKTVEDAATWKFGENARALEAVAASQRRL